MENLKKLQQIEDHILELKATRDRLQKEEQLMTTEVTAIQTEVDRLHANLEDSSKGIRELRSVLAEGQERVVKSEKRLLEIRTVKEQMAVTREKETAKQANREVQEKIKEKENEIDRLKKEKEEREMVLEELQERVNNRHAEIAPQLADFEQTLGTKMSHRVSLLATLSPGVKRRYQILVEQRGGTAVVEARNSACMGCNMKLPPQFFNSLFLKQEIQCCPHCNRFLYIHGEEEKPASGA
ncbi:MAG: hypothetical protein GXY54_07360 [Deltaproteobacteria bacterium]|nr:hypothetical protein [Deltaproteobacteria bacterium]